MLIFNDLISSHNWIDLPFTGRSFTWSNMQTPPLLVKLDWVFCSTDWLMAYPNSVVQPLSRPISDHVPYVTRFSSGILRATYGY
jgi:endonuclease/exonuclease/phosphatase family metal-dependent hydrolase